MPTNNSREKAGWKAIQIDWDFIQSLSDRECSYCLTDQQVAALLGMTEYLNWPTRWRTESDEIDKDQLEAFTAGLEDALMTGCCDDNLPIQWRYGTDGVLERSLNGGGVWVDAPEYDPRNYSPQFPEPIGDDVDDKKCVAATGAALLIQEQVGDQLTDDMSRYTLDELIKDWIGTWLQTTDPFLMLLTIAANQIFALGIAILRPALTSGVYEQLKCILYCNMGDDISFTASQWETVRSEITSQIAGIAGLFLEHLVYVLGVVGLTNVVRAGGAAEGDCSDCGCSDCECDFESWIAAGNFVSCEGNSVTVEAILFEGMYVVYMVYGAGTTYDVNICRQVDGDDFPVGSANNGYNECHVGTAHFGFLSACGAQHFWQDIAPFTVTIDYGTCEDCG